MTSRPTPPAGDVPARRASYATSCTAICVVGSVSRRSWSASSITRQLGMPPPHESHHLPAAVITASDEWSSGVDPDRAKSELEAAVRPAFALEVLAEQPAAGSSRRGGCRSELATLLRNQRSVQCTSAEW